jgi:glycosyltransferase involved in cell wall biosynthesis
MSKIIRNNRKIVFLTKSIDGGTGTSVLQLLSGLREKRYSVKILVLEKPSYRLVKDSDINYFQKTNYYPVHYSLSIRNIADFFKEILWLRKKIKNLKAKVLLGTDIRSNLIIQINKLIFPSVNTILTTRIDIHATIRAKSDSITKFLLEKCIVFFYKRSNVLITTSKKLSHSIQKLTNSKFEPLTIYNGLKIVKKKPKRYPNSAKKIIVTAGRIVEQKDYYTLINAYKRLIQSKPKLEFWIIGDGPEINKLKEYCRKLRITHRVIFFGWKQNVRFYLNKANLFVFSSKREGFGWVLLEAMSIGLPVLSTDTPYGPSEILENGKYGILTPIGDVKQLVRSIKKVLFNRNIYNYYAKKSVQRIQKFSVNRMIKSYIKVIEQLR